MDAYFNYFYNFMRHVFESIYNVIIAIGEAIVAILDIPFYMDLFNSYKNELSPLGWIAAILTHILFYILLALIVFLIGRGIKVLFKFKVNVVEYEKMRDEVVRLKREIMKVNYEKDKILAMKISDMGIQVDDKIAYLQGDNSGEQIYEESTDNIRSEEELSMEQKMLDEVAATVQEETKDMHGEVSQGPFRFPKLSAVDQHYRSPQYIPPEYDNRITLEELCINFRNYAASQLDLFYDLEVIKHMFAAFGATKMLIFQGISGTGKTSLPYAVGQFIQNPSLICSVQPSWRDRTELFGYYNDFTKRYTETDFLKTIYEAHFYDDMKIVILDEMNIARVEYYFAEMLSILELPREDERHFSLVSSKGENDPVKMVDGKIWIPSNIWYVGTINNDDSTFAVSDKVYDRAIPIDLDDRAEPFEAPVVNPMRISYTHLNALYRNAMESYPISAENLALLDKLDTYLIEHFRLTFGNRILRQVKEYVPCYIACGGTEIDGIDFMFAKKILRKFESLGLGFIREELDGLLLYLDSLFGVENFTISKSYLRRLKKMSGSN